MTTDPRDLYTVEEDTAAALATELGAAPAAGPGPDDPASPGEPRDLVLVHALRGFVDAGGAGEVATEHLLERFESRRLVTFDADQLVDYRARRPMMTFDVWRWRDYDPPQLVVDLLRDADGVPFLLMHGLEPDVAWERFAAAVRRLVERFGVRLVVGMHGIPMAVPHTRPLEATRHGTRRELTSTTGWFGMVQVPGSAASLLEYRLGRWGVDAAGVGVHVPHYLAQSAFPAAARTALRHVEEVAALALDADELAGAAAEAIEQVDRQVAESPDVAAVVRALEEQYDGAARTLGVVGLLADPSDLPTADEIGAELERFLAEQPPPEDD